MTPHTIIQWFSQQENRRWLGVVILVAAASFWLGYWTSDRRLADKMDEAARRRVEEVLRIGDQLGFIDRKRLNEVLIIMSEERGDDSQSEHDHR